ncbi:MAG: hypothetical protein IKT27_03670 [Clostridia bacterium]|nr:hypothetical protein [Clostridia bacterium]
MSRLKKYPISPHGDADTVVVPKWEYDSLREIAKLHEDLLERVRVKLPTVYTDFKKAHGK